MAHLLQVIVTLLLLYVSPWIYNLLRNIFYARAVGLPLLLVPIDHTGLPWFILYKTGKTQLRRVLPARLWRRLSLTILGWQFHEKTWPFDQVTGPYGTSFLLGGFGKLELWTADPKVAEEILSRVYDFKNPEVLRHSLGQFGPNVITTNGSQWARHRRLFTSVMDERISKTVFDHSIRQIRHLLDSLLESAPNKPDSIDTPLLFDMLKQVSLQVILSAAAATGSSTEASLAKDKVDQPPESGYTMTYTESILTIVTNVVGLAMVPTNILTHWPRWFPGHQAMNKVGCAKLELARRSQSIINHERDRRAKSESAGTAKSFMSKLLQASEDGIASGQSLSEGEMISNLFIFTAGGYESTSTTFAYAVTLLARYPQWQDWLIEEIDGLTAVDGDDNKPMKYEYTTVFPRANRILAFMLETLRLYPPVPQVHREITSPQAFQTSTGRTIQLPAGTRVYLNSVALHLSPCWRDINRQSDPTFCKADLDSSDEYVFRPSRWIGRSIYRPPKGTFLPWSIGPRVCPGQKMAQVEFTAVMMALLRRHRVEAVPLEGESRRQMEDRLDGRLRDSQWHTVLQMNGVFHPKNNEGLFLRISRRPTNEFMREEGESP